MPQLIVSQALTANQLGFNPFSGWQYEYVPMAYARGAAVSVMARCTGTSARAAFFSGSQTIQQRSPIQGGGTAGTTPSPLNTTPLSWIAKPGDRLLAQIDEVSGLTPTVDLLIQMEPL